MIIKYLQSDSAGEPTIASRYTQWYSDVLLRRVSAGHICFSNTLRSFVSLSAEGAIPFNAEEFTDPTELRSLAELLGEQNRSFLIVKIPSHHVDIYCPLTTTKHKINSNNFIKDNKNNFNISNFKSNNRTAATRSVRCRLFYHKSPQNCQLYHYHHHH